MPIHPLLAADLTDLITVAVVLIFGVGGTIASALKKAAEARKARLRQQEALLRGQTPAPLSSDDPPAMPTAAAGDSPARSLEEIAAHRRAELQRLAQKRPASAPLATAPTPPPAAPLRSAAALDTQPGNLSIQEAAARARAKAAYEARVAALRAQAQQAVQAQRSTPTVRPASSPTPQRAPQRPGQRPRPARPGRSAPQRPSALPSQPIVQRSSASGPTGVRRPPLAPVEQSAESLVDHYAIDTGESTAHRHVTDAGTTSTTPNSRSRIARPTGHQLRAALIYKEILDPPLALRS